MSQNPFETKDLLDRALKVVSLREYTKAAAVSNILEVLESKADDMESLYMTIAFCERQAARGIISQGMADGIAKNLQEIAKSGISNKKQVAREFLGFVKWIFEIAERRRIDLRNVRDFDDLIAKLGGRE
jgi:hypothetical protein